MVKGEPYVWPKLDEIKILSSDLLNNKRSKMVSLETLNKLLIPWEIPNQNNPKLQQVILVEIFSCPHPNGEHVKLGHNMGGSMTFSQF